MARADQTDTWEDDSQTVSGPAAARAIKRARRDEAPEAYLAGHDGLPSLPDWGPEDLAAWAQGKADAEAENAPSLKADQEGAAGATGQSFAQLRREAAKAAKPSKPRGDDFAGFVFGMVLAANVMAFLDYGAAGVKSWWSAKFWNSPNTALSASAASGAGANPNGQGVNYGRGVTLV